MLIAAVTQYEQLTGDEVDVEEAAIARAFKKLAGEELNALLPVIAEARANGLPVIGLLEEYRDTLQEVQGAASDDAVRILAGEGQLLPGDARHGTEDPRGRGREEPAHHPRRPESPSGSCGPSSRSGSEGEDLDGEGRGTRRPALFRDVLRAGAPYRAPGPRDRAAYLSPYTDLHRRRREAFSEAVEEIESLPEWASVPEGVAASVLRPLTSRACEQDGLPEGATVCPVCHATMGEMETELAALSELQVRGYRPRSGASGDDGTGRRRARAARRVLRRGARHAERRWRRRRSGCGKTC